MLNETGLAPRRRRERRHRRPAGASKTFRRVLALAFAVLIGWGAWGLFGTGPAKDGKTTVVKVEPEKPKKKPVKNVISQRTFVLLGVAEADGEKRLTGALQVVFDPAQNRIAGLFVDPGTFAVIPGRGLQSIADGFSEGPKKLAEAVSGVVGVEAEGYLIVSEAEFGALRESKDVPALFSKYADGNVPRTESKTLAEQMAVIPIERRNLYDLPVREIALGESSYYEPTADELTRLVKAIWGKPPQKKEGVLRVIILNGNGAPGLGRKAADRLVGRGYKIIDVKNADHFNYPTTRVKAYNKEARGAAPKMIKALGVGKLDNESMAQDVTDAVILLGKDFM